MLGLEMGEEIYLQSVLFGDRPDDIPVHVTDSPFSCLCKYFMFLIITSPNTLTVYDQEKMEKKIQLFLSTKTKKSL